jgi:carboxymethylenebutenolidase
MQLNHLHTYLIEEFAEDYLERKMARRDLLRKVLLLTGSVPLTASVLFALGCGSSDDDEDVATPAPPTATPAAAAVHGSVPADDPAVQGADVRFPGPASELLGYLARPKAEGTYPAVVIIHENRGLLDHFKDVARRYAKIGYAALAVDLLSRSGGTSTDANANTAALRNPEGFVPDLVADVNYLKSQPFVKASAIGVTGFCMGGNYTFETAVASPDIKAAVPYYGVASNDVLTNLTKTNAAFLVIYGGNDNRVTSQRPVAEQALRDAGKTFEVKEYPGAGHQFFNDTAMAYNAEAAADAWTQTIAWFRKYLV